MKILILTTNTGGGHNAAAKAIQEEAFLRGISCDIVNFMRFTPKYKEKFVVQGHTLAYRFIPKIYGVCYHHVESQKKSGQRLYLKYSKYAEALKSFILKGKYDTVIAVHIFAGLMLTKIREETSLPIRQYLVITDYTCSPGAVSCDMDAWFVPKGLKSTFLEQGAPEKYIIESGIPCSRTAYETVGKKAARTVLKVDQNMPLIFICAGTMPPVSINLMVRKFLHKRKDWHLIVLFGNRGAVRHLAADLNEPRVTFIEHTNDMFLWMQAADIYITKAGGLTITEAASCGVPLILMNAVPGPESYNRDYMFKNQCAFLANHLDEMTEKADFLINHPSIAEEMILHQRECFSDMSVVRLMDYVTAAVDLAGEEKRNDVGF